jgi:hypothetical protein
MTGRADNINCLVFLVTLALALGTVWGSRAEEPVDEAAQEVFDCMKRNVPDKTSEQTVRFKQVDRVGGDRTSRGKILGKRKTDGLRRVKLCFTKPQDVRGSELLVIENKSRSNDMFMYSPELRKSKRIISQGAKGSVFGTDFSYEDFERWQGLEKAGDFSRLEDSFLGDRPVFVVSSKPAPEVESVYEEVVSFVDKETCVTLRSESFEPGKKLRKVLSANPEHVQRNNGIWIATEVTMRDVRDETETQVAVEDIEIDQPINDQTLSLGQLGRRCK